MPHTIAVWYNRCTAARYTTCDHFLGYTIWAAVHRSIGRTLPVPIYCQANAILVSIILTLFLLVRLVFLLVAADIGTVFAVCCD